MTSLDLPAESGAGARPRRAAGLRLGTLVAAGSAALAAAAWLPLPGFPLCAMRLFTGLPCPGCGMTRSIVRLCQGDVAASFRFHPLGVVLVAALVSGAGGALVGLARGHDPVWAFAGRRAGFLAAGFGAALVGVWVLRAFVVPEWAPDPIGPPVWSASLDR